MRNWLTLMPNKVKLSFAMKRRVSFKFPQLIWTVGFLIGRLTCILLARQTILWDGFIRGIRLVQKPSGIGYLVCVEEMFNKIAKDSSLVSSWDWAGTSANSDTLIVRNRIFFSADFAKVLTFSTSYVSSSEI